MAGTPDKDNPVKSPSRLKEVAGFEIIGKLGQGGMGAVFKARQKSLDRIVALKVLPPEIAKDKQFIERFQREARASAKLNHPNIVQGIDVGNDPATGLWYFAMEFIEGPSLRKILDEQKSIPEARVLEIARAIGRALEAVDSHKMVHRDIKPDNILIAPDGEPKLADLGLAKQLNDDISLTQSGQAVGTPYYMAPEQAQGKSSECDIRTDIYALGATLFHLITGRPPFDGETGAVIMVKHLMEPPPKAHKVNPAISEACSRLIEKMMQKKVEQRIQSPSQLVQQIDKILSGESMPTPAAAHRSAGPRAPATERKRAVAAPASGSKMLYAGIGVVAIAVVVALLLKSKNPQSAMVSNDKKETVHEQPVQDVKKPAPAPMPNPAEKPAVPAVTKNVASTAAPKPVPEKVEPPPIPAAGQNAAAESAWKAAEVKAAALAGAGNFDGALAAWQFPPEHAAALKPKADERIRLLHTQAQQTVSTLMKKAQEQAAAADLDGALKTLAEAEKITYAPSLGAVTALKNKISEELAAGKNSPHAKFDPATAARLNEALQKFDQALLEARDPKIAAQVAGDAKKDPALKPAEAIVRAMNDVVGVFNEIARTELEKLKSMVGQKVEFETTSGVMKGAIARVQESGISFSIDIGAGAYAEKKIKLTDLTDSQRKKTFDPFVPQNDAQRVAQSYLLLAKGSQDFKSASVLLQASPDFALTPHVSELAGKMRDEKEKSMAEVAAPKLWTEIQSKGMNPQITDAEAKSVNELIDRFEKEFSATQFAATNKEKFEAVKGRVSRILLPNLLVNGDFEKGSWDGWEKQGGSLSAEMTSDDPHGGKHAVHFNIQRDYFASLTQFVTVEPKTEYRATMWVKHVKGPLDQGRGGLFLMDGDAERKEVEGRFIPVFTQAKLGEWVKLELKFTPQTTRLRVELWTRQTSKAVERYSMHFDDIEVSRSNR
jgi:serine/threonine protein kinase